MNFDADQRAAIDVRCNAVVTAGAGSGKTSVLTERFVSLVVERATSVDRILTLTFTRKAAAEMFTRIHGALSRATAEHSHIVDQLARFDRAVIATLDSFCATVLSERTSELGLAPNVGADPLRTDTELAAALRRLVWEAAEQPGIADLLHEHGSDALVERVLLPLVRDYCTLSDTERPGRYLALQERRLTTAATAAREGARRILDELARTTPQTKAAAAAREGTLLHREDLGALHDYLRTLPRRFSPKDEQAVQVKDLLKQLYAKSGRTPRGVLADLEAIEALQRDAPRRRGVYAVLDRAFERVQRMRRSSGLLGFDDVVRLAVELLRDDADLRAAYQRRFDFIMIDEFQDNNPLQRDLLYLLAARPGSAPGRIPAPADLASDRLFLVGDEKQSIYRFRGADVAVFRNIADELAAHGGRRLQLGYNYRSGDRLIAFFNTTFANVFADATADYEARHQELNAGRGVSIDPAVCIAWASGNARRPGDAGAIYAEAAWVAERIHRLQSETDTAYGDIAILLRSTGNQHVYERMLRRAGIPYRSTAVRSLFAAAPAADIQAFLQLLCYPTDRAAYAAVLRGPLVNVGDDTVAAIFTAAEPLGLFVPPEGCNASDRAKLAAAAELYAELVQSADVHTPAELITTLWYRGGYRYSILHRPADHRFDDHLDYLRALAEPFAELPLVAFVDELWQRLREDRSIVGRKDEVTFEPDHNAVQIMTIHSAKGLEFPVVFVVNCGSVPQARADTYLADSTLGPIVNLPARGRPDERLDYLSRAARRAAESAERAELKRLLYVAATRARDRLYCTAALQHEAPRAGSILALLAEALPIDFTRREAWTHDGVQFEPIAPIAEEELARGYAAPAPRRCAEFADVLARVVPTDRARRRKTVTPTEFAVADAALANVEPTPHHATDAVRSSEHTTDEDATAFGTLVHAVLEHRIAHGLTRRQLLNATPAAIRGLLSEHGIDLGARGDEAWALSEAFIGHPLWRTLAAEVSDTDRITTEMAFVSSLPDGWVCRGTIDLIVRTDRATYVIDFKTDRALDPERYRGQMALYRRAAAAIGGEPVVTVLFGLRNAEALEIDATIDDDRIARVLQSIAVSVYDRGYG